MKNLLLSISAVVFFNGILFGQSLRFLDVVQKPSKSTAVEAQLNERGGTISFDREYRSGCVGGYKVKVTFSTSLNMLQPGETFLATLNCVDCSTPCGYKWGIVDLLASNNITSIDQYPNYISNENIELVGSSNGSSGVNDWESGMMSNVITMRYEPKKAVPLTGMKIVVAGDHEIYYVFESTGGGVSPTPGSDLVEGIWSGWGTMTFNITGPRISGTYSDTYVSSDRGGISLFRNNNGVWNGTWEEPGIGRRGNLYDIKISSDGKKISGKYNVTQDGGKGNWAKDRSFSWVYKSRQVKQ